MVSDNYVSEIFDGGYRRVEAISLPQALAPAAVGLSLMAPSFGLGEQAQAAPMAPNTPIVQQQQGQLPMNVLNQIVQFYSSGKAQTANFPTQKPGAEGGNWGTGPNGNVFQGQANYSPEVLRRLQMWYPQRNKPNAGAVLGTEVLAVIIHEALHTRENQPDFADWQEDEPQARAWSFQLVPDMMQRFFDIPMNSKIGQEYQQVANKFIKEIPSRGSIPLQQSTPLG